MKWVGPCIIQNAVALWTFTLKNPDGTTQVQKANGCRLKPYHGKEVEDGDQDKFPVSGVFPCKDPPWETSHRMRKACQMSSHMERTNEKEKFKMKKTNQNNKHFGKIASMKKRN